MSTIQHGSRWQRDGAYAEKPCASILPHAHASLLEFQSRNPSLMALPAFPSKHRQRFPSAFSCVPLFCLPCSKTAAKHRTGLLIALPTKKTSVPCCLQGKNPAAREAIQRIAPSFWGMDLFVLLVVSEVVSPI